MPYKIWYLDMQKHFLIFSTFLLFSRTIYASDSIATYSNIVRKTPSDWNTRYELAKLYFNAHQYSAAQYNFEFITAQCDTPDTIKNTTNKYLSEIRHNKKWDTEFGIGAIPDSSINYSPSNRYECINTPNGPICSELRYNPSGFGLNINGALNYYANIYKNLGLRTTFGGAVLNTSNDIPTDYSTHFAIGPRYIFSNGDIFIQPSFGTRFYNNHLYNTSYGARIGGTLQFPSRLFTDTALDIKHNHYHDKNINNILSGFDWTFYIHPKYYLNNHSFISFTAAISHNETAIPALGSDTGRIAIGYFYKIPYGFNFYINAMYSHSKYHTSGTFVIDNEFHHTTRHDNIYQIYTRIYNSYINLYNFIPAISYTYTIQESNIPAYDHHTHQAILEIVRMF